MSNRIAGPDYQALAAQFSPGDVAVPYGATPDYAGRVVAVWPAIGMVDLQFPGGTKRYPTEELLRLDKNGNPDPPHDGNNPGGAGTVSVPGGPVRSIPTVPAGSPQRQAAEWGHREMIPVMGTRLVTLLDRCYTNANYIGSDAYSFKDEVKAFFTQRGRLIRAFNAAFPGFKIEDFQLVNYQGPGGTTAVKYLSAEIAEVAKELKVRVENYKDSIPANGPSWIRAVLDAVDAVQDACKDVTVALQAHRVATAHVKEALYWAAPDRLYRATAEESTSGKFTCPKCRAGALRKAIYRRMQGQSEHLLGCPTCMFLIQRDSLIHPMPPQGAV